MARCDVCFRQCELKEGQAGSCGARANAGGEVRPLFYGRISSLALDPIGKKPLNQFHPGSRILSVGSLGCNLHCPFCQNHEIAQAEAGKFPVETEEINGCASLRVLEEIIPYIDAMNIDLKGFTDGYYRDTLKGDRGMVMDFIREAAKHCHVELTTLIVPGMNDSEGEMRELSGWIAGLREVFGGKTGRDIPLHISRFFPRYRMTDREPTEVRKVYSLVKTARENLRWVYPGNC